MKPDALRAAIIDLCQQAGRTTDHSIDLVDSLIDSLIIDDDDEPEEDEAEEEGFCTCPSAYYATGEHYPGCPLAAETRGSK